MSLTLGACSKTLNEKKMLRVETGSEGWGLFFFFSYFKANVNLSVTQINSD